MTPDPPPPGTTLRESGLRGTDAHATDHSGDDSLAETFWGVARRLRRLSKDALAPWDVTPGQSRALGVLVRNGEMRPGALSEHLRIAPRSATEVVDDLEEHGLVERAPDPADRRATLVRVTARGREVADGIRAARSAEAEEFFRGLDARDRAELARILGSLRD